MTSAQQSELDALLHPVQVPYAPIWKRFLAWLIDIAIFLFIVQFITHLYWPNMHWSYRKYAEPLAFATVYSLMALLYVPLLEATGGTIGKRLLGIRPISIATNQSPTIWQSFKRSLFVAWPLVFGLLYNGALILYANTHTYELPDFSKMSSAEVGQNILNHQVSYDYHEPNNTNLFLLSFLVIIVVGGIIGVLVTPMRQAWHDRFAKVVVVSRKSRNS